MSVGIEIAEAHVSLDDRQNNDAVLFDSVDDSIVADEPLANIIAIDLGYASTDPWHSSSAIRAINEPIEPADRGVDIIERDVIADAVQLLLGLPRPPSARSHFAALTR